MPEEPPVTSPPFDPEVITSPFDENNPVTSPPDGNNPVITSPPDQLEELSERGKDNTSSVVDNIKVDKLSALQKAGFRLAIGVGAVITLVILVTLAQAVYLMFNPKTDSVFSSQQKFEQVMRDNANTLSNANASEQDITKANDAIKQAKENVDEALQNDSTWNRITSLFDLVVVKALLPIFTTILGYIFGSRVGSEDQ